MTTTTTTPKSNIPIGRVTIGGVTYDVPQHPEFVRFFFDLVRRAGGATAMSNTELADAINDAELAPPVAQQNGAATFPDTLLAPRCEPLPGATDDPNGRIQALEAEVARLAALVNDLQLGYQL